VLVADVDAGSEAAGRGIKRGDVIMQTNQGVVATPADVVRMIVSAKTSGRKSLLLLLKNSGGEVVFVALPLG
jgi:serine protease Do